jgi:hypothetical protein
MSSRLQHLAKDIARPVARLMGLAHRDSSPLELRMIADGFGQLTSDCPGPLMIRETFDEMQDARELGDLFCRHGSDKATKHDYHLAYGSLLASRRSESLRLLEVGIGSVNPRIPSNMGLSGVPGASLRAWRDWAPLFQIIGADIDPATMLGDERIETIVVDQLSSASLAGLAERVRPVDIVIVDGLHVFAADLKTLIAGLSMLNRGGMVAVEDVVPGAFGLWRAVSAVLANRYDCRLYVGAAGEGLMIITAA